MKACPREPFDLTSSLAKDQKTSSDVWLRKRRHVGDARTLSREESKIERDREFSFCGNTMSIVFRLRSLAIILIRKKIKIDFEWSNFGLIMSGLHKRERFEGMIFLVRNRRSVLIFSILPSPKSETEFILK